jgi:ribosome biogenesis GTPase
VTPRREAPRSSRWAGLRRGGTETVRQCILSDRQESSLPTTSAASGLLALGWDDGWASALADLRDPTLSPARVSRVDRGVCTVMTGATEARATSLRDVEVAVGDWVAVAPRPTADGRAQIAAVLPRRGVFRRLKAAKGASPQIVAANVDTVFLCDALDGSLSLRHLERFLALAWQSGATPVVLITKSDAVAPAAVAGALEAVRAVADGVSVLVVSATTGDGMVDVAPYLVAGRTVAVLGLSGAGKSTLVNLLAGAEILITGAVRRDGSGRHTTSHRELVLLPGGGLLIDTPGMRSLSVAGAGEGVEQTFHDVEVLARRCRYTNCSHGGEGGCAVESALADGRLEQSRFESWLRLRSEPEVSQLEITRGEIAERKRRKAEKFADRRSGRS